jgi:hypothetical protein
MYKSRGASQPNMDSGCTCALCKDRRDFVLPEHLKKKFYEHDLVIFAGAGISTENRVVFPYTLYDDVKAELGIAADKPIQFSTLMERYCNQPDGRALLLQKIKKRFDYVSAFPELYRIATRFHKELATLHFIDTIITTNWDDFFERECGAIPFVMAQDFAFWNTEGRKVFKIHGSISNYGSIIATDTDYRKCRKSLRDGILGATLKHIIGTKTIVYVGYSFADSDFNQIFRFLREEMGTVVPNSYMVTPYSSQAKAIAARGVTPIITDGQQFLSVLKEHAVADGRQIEDSRFEGIPLTYGLLMAAHEELHKHYRASDSPFMIYTSSYQDGFMQALERAMARMCTGEYSCPGCLARLIGKYEDIRKEKRRRRKLTDVAYVDGYLNGLNFILAPDYIRMILPLWYLTSDTEPPKSLREYSRALRKAKRTHPDWLKYAQKVARTYVGQGGPAEFHHTPFLL